MAHNTGLTVLGQPASVANAIVLESEDDAWKLLADLQREDFEPPSDIILGDWSRLRVCLDGEEWDSSIKPSLFPAFQQLQQIVHHSYAKARYGDKNKRLTNQEKEDLEIVIYVGKGSSDTNTKVDFAEVAKACVDKMTRRQLFHLILLLALAWGSESVIRQWIQYKRDIRVAEIQNEDRKAVLEAWQFSTEKDREKYELFVEALRRDDVTISVEDEIDNLHHEVLKSATKAEKSKINGVRLEKPVAEELLKSKRMAPTPTQINGQFRIINLDWTTPHEITLRRLEDGLLLKAAFDLAWLSEEAKSIIRNTEWKEDGDKVFHANINARIAEDGRIVNAELVRVSRNPEDNNDDAQRRPKE